MLREFPAKVIEAPQPDLPNTRQGLPVRVVVERRTAEVAARGELDLGESAMLFPSDQALARLKELMPDAQPQLVLWRGADKTKYCMKIQCMESTATHPVTVVPVWGIDSDVPRVGCPWTCPMRAVWLIPSRDEAQRHIPHRFEQRGREAADDGWSVAAPMSPIAQSLGARPRSQP